VNVIDVKSMTQIFAIEENKSNDGPVTKLAVHSDSDHIVSLTASAVRVWLLTDEKVTCVFLFVFEILRFGFMFDRYLVLFDCLF
jgi:hypothetical protein